MGATGAKVGATASAFTVATAFFAVTAVAVVAVVTAVTATTAARALARLAAMATASISAISSDLSVSISFVIANELVDAGRDEGLRNDELAAVLVAIVVLVSAAKSMVDRAAETAQRDESARVAALAKTKAGELGLDSYSSKVFVSAAVDETASQKGILAFISELLGIAARISLSVTIQVLAVSVSATGSSRLLRVGTLLSVVFFFLFFEAAFVKKR